MKKLLKTLFFISFIILISCESRIDIRLYRKKFNSIRVFNPADFIVKIDLSSASTDDLFLPVNYAYDYDFEVNWGDGSIESYKLASNGSNLITHKYQNTTSEIILSISGIVQGFGGTDNTCQHSISDKLNIINFASELVNMGDLNFINLQCLFENNNIITLIDFLKDDAIAEFKDVVNMNSIFRNTANLSYINLQGLDLSKVQTMAFAFSYVYRLESIDLSGMNLSSLTSTNQMFYSSIELKEVDFNSSDLRSLASAEGMFSYNSNFKTADFSNANLSSLNNTRNMFRRAPNLELVNFTGATISTPSSSLDMFRDTNGTFLFYCPGMTIVTWASKACTIL